MSLSDNYKPVKYIGNGTTKDFSFNFNMINQEYCRVFLEDKTTGAQTPKNLDADYSLVFDDNGGQVSMKVAPLASQYIVVYRDVDLNQKSDFRVGEGFAAVKIEDEFDKQMAAIQQMDDGLNRSPKVAEGYSGSLTLPNPDAGKALIWNENENGFKNSTVDVNHLEAITKQYRDEAEAARDAARVSENNAKASENAAKASQTAAASSAQSAANTVNGFDVHAAEKQSAFDTNAAQKTQAFNDNAQSKTNTFNTNAAQKQAAVDASAEEARKWAVGTISEQPQGSAKYWAENAKAVTDGTLNETLITNCITKIPQDIKLELSNGTMTLKAGSKVYVPNGAGVFDEVVINTDKINSNTTYSSGSYALFYNATDKGLTFVLTSNCSSETTPPSTGFSAWYDKTNNIIKFYNNGTFINKTASFPLAILEYANGVGTVLIKHVFNGLGYIGSTIFVLPGVEGLSPNGRNTDGSLNSRKFTSNTVQTINSGEGTGSTYYILSNLSNSTRNAYAGDTYIQDEKPDISALYGVWYSPKENYIRFTNDRGNTWTIANWICLGNYTNDSNGKPSILQNKSVFRAVDYWEYDQDAAKLNKDNTFNGIVTAFTNPINFVAKGKMVKGQTPSGNVYCGYDFQDTNNERLAYLGVNYSSSGTKILELQKLDSNLTEFFTTFVIKATTPADSASGREVTTAQWVRKYGAQLDYAKGVTISGNGDKTASSNGVLMINASSQNNQGIEQVTLVVEGQTFYFGNGTVNLDVPHIGQVYFPLKAGQKYNITSPNWSKITAKFFPYA